MKLPNPQACLRAFGRGKFKTQTALGESLTVAFSDRGSIPLTSTELIESIGDMLCMWPVDSSVSGEMGSWHTSRADGLLCARGLTKAMKTTIITEYTAAISGICPHRVWLCPLRLADEGRNAAGAWAQTPPGAPACMGCIGKDGFNGQVFRHGRLSR